MHDPPLAPWLRRSTAIQTLSGRWWLSFCVRTRRWLWLWLVNGSKTVKRAFDIIASLVALILFGPLFLLIGLLIKIEDGGPVIFQQTRVGKFGREFKMYKFRSMCLDAETRLPELLKKNQHREGVTFKIK